MKRGCRKIINNRSEKRDDRYIISYLCKNETGIYIEFARQKVIGVEDVVTVYISDIYEIK